MRVQVQVRVADDEAPESGIYPTRLVVLGAVTGAAMNEELTHRERFVLLYVDGASSIADILGTLEAVGYAREEVATILRALVERGLVVVRRAQALVREIA